MKNLVFLLILLVPLNVYAGWLFGPNNLEECVAENVKTASSEVAAKIAYMACEGLFPEKKYKTYEQCVNEKRREKAVLEKKGRWVAVEEPAVLPPYKSAFEALVDPESDCRKYFPTVETKKYYKCLLKGMKGVANDTAAGVIATNCKKKYLKD